MNAGTTSAYMAGQHDALIEMARHMLREQSHLVSPAGAADVPTGTGPIYRAIRQWLSDVAYGDVPPREIPEWPEDLRDLIDEEDYQDACNPEHAWALRAELEALMTLARAVAQACHREGDAQSVRMLSAAIRQYVHARIDVAAREALRASDWATA